MVSLLILDTGVFERGTCDAFGGDFCCGVVKGEVEFPCYGGSSIEPSSKSLG